MSAHQADLEGVYTPSPDIVAREIGGELVIVPLTAGIGDMEEELYSFNETGLAVWKCFDGYANLKGIVERLAANYDAPSEEIQKDVLGLVEELLQRNILVPGIPA